MRKRKSKRKEGKSVYRKSNQINERIDTNKLHNIIAAKIQFSLIRVILHSYIDIKS